MLHLARRTNKGNISNIHISTICNIKYFLFLFNLKYLQMWLIPSVYIISLNKQHKCQYNLVLHYRESLQLQMYKYILFLSFLMIRRISLDLPVIDFLNSNWLNDKYSDFYFFLLNISCWSKLNLRRWNNWPQ